MIETYSCYIYVFCIYSLFKDDNEITQELLDSACQLLVERAVHGKHNT